ncbi:cytidine deaminase [Actinokineospora sp.]|uniref:cytidine deaminase n=1 Tax=Actinokineospora sp. TaxID=1872133 RepID=UPI0040381A8C
MTADSRPPLRVALFGLPGAGKSTSAGLLRQTLAELGYHIAVVKLAAPLYDVQDFFYTRTDSPLADGQQDGALLNFLGSHFRRTAPEFLLADFAERCANATLGGADVIICDDARPTDLDGLADQGFRIARITVPDALRRARKVGRGDRTVGNDEHPTEAGGESVTSDFEIDNSGGVAELADRIVELAKALMALPDRDLGVVERKHMLESLVEHARAAITPRYAENRHQIGAVILAGDGRIFTGIHLEAMVGRASICAEAVALGKACAAGATDLRVVAAVRHPKPSEAAREIKLVPPCGLCRELLLDYGRDLRVVVATDGELDLVPLSGMLPHKYVGTKWPAAGSPRKHELVVE